VSPSEINVGDTAPAFSLKDQDGNDHSLPDYKGKKVVLSFHPLAWTGVCTTQMQQLDSKFDKIAELGGVGFGFSVDSTFCKHAWCKDMGVEKTRLLSDFWPHGGYAAQLGLFRDVEGTAKRAVVILNADGKVAWKKVYPIPEVPDIEEIMSELEKA
jgi:peroxiredoxin